RDAERIGGSGCSASSARVQTVYFDANAGQAEGGCMHARYGAVVAVTLAVLPCACGNGLSATSPTLKSPTTASAAVPPAAGGAESTSTPAPTLSFSHPGGE